MHNKQIVILILCAIFGGTAEAKLYKWVDDNGVTHYGETIPPEYANKDATRFSDKGRIEKQIDKLTPEEQRARKSEASQKKIEQQATLESKRRDNALLSTFSNENEIDLARDRGLQQIEARIKGVTLLIQSAQDSLEAYNKEKAGLLANNKQLPKSLIEDISKAEEKVVKLQKELTAGHRPGVAEHQWRSAGQNAHGWDQPKRRSQQHARRRRPGAPGSAFGPFPPTGQEEGCQAAGQQNGQRG